MRRHTERRTAINKPVDIAILLYMTGLPLGNLVANNRGQIDCHRRQTESNYFDRTSHHRGSVIGTFECSVRRNHASLCLRR